MGVKEHKINGTDSNNQYKEYISHSETNTNHKEEYKQMIQLTILLEQNKDKEDFR